VALVFSDVGFFKAGLFSLSGSAQSATDAISRLMTVNGWPSSDLDVWFHWTSAGWQGLAHDDPPVIALETWNTAGGLTSKLGSINAIASAPDGQGGSVLVGMDPAGSGQGHLAWIGPDGTLRRDVVLDREPWRGIVRWDTGHVLVLSTAAPGDATARWFGADGAPLTPWFDARFVIRWPAPALTPMVRVLLDGRPVVYDGTAWTGAFRDGTTTVDAPPAWLAHRAGKRLAVLPGGRGYAVLGGDVNTDLPLEAGPVDVELLTPDGQSCGMVTPPPGPAPTRGSRPVFGYFVGQDGTLIEGSTLGGPELGPGSHCAFRWWPRLLGE
jgi:hypothetical protein